ncbi:MAG TPA: sigma-70 family RNA polymerase sigma factor [Puia sp.]|nr:sigma-70 family RNA polymerase sigma factor [Puia sp.]
MAETLSAADILAFQAGDRAACKKIYLYYYRSIYLFILAVVQNTAEAADIYHRIIVKLWQKRKKYDSAGAIKGFLLISARNAGLDYLRASRTKVKAHKEISFLAQNEEPWDIFEQPKKDMVQEIYALADSLTPKCREVFNLIFIDGKKTKEIAKQLNISISSVLGHKSRALKLIRLELIKKNFLPEG